MVNALLGTAIAGALALGFALVGETILSRTSRDLFRWNESFLVGSGVCAALLFPLSLVFPASALNAELALIGLCSVLAIGRRLVTRSAGESGASVPTAAPPADWVSRLLLAAILAIFVFFALLNLRYGHSWDSVQVWGTKAKRLFFEGSLSRRWFLEDPYDARLLAYPQLLPFVEALFSRLRGSFDFDRLKPIFPYFYASALLGTYSAARALCSRRWAFAVVLLVALLPELSTGEAAGGYADMPMAAFVAAVAAAATAGLCSSSGRADGRPPLAWLIGAMTTLKQEGMILAVVACGTFLAAWAVERPRRVGKRLRAAWAGAVVVLAFAATRVGYVSWIGIHDTTWGPFDAEHRARALHSLGLVASVWLRLLLAPWKWGLFWPAFFAAAALLVAARQQRPALLALAVVAAIAIEGSLFLMTNWDMALHIEGAYTRLLAQLAPAAAVVIGAGASRVWAPAGSAT